MFIFIPSHNKWLFLKKPSSPKAFLGLDSPHMGKLGPTIDLLCIKNPHLEKSERKHRKTVLRPSGGDLKLSFTLCPLFSTPIPFLVVIIWKEYHHTIPNTIFTTHHDECVVFVIFSSFFFPFSTKKKREDDERREKLFMVYCCSSSSVVVPTFQVF